VPYLNVNEVESALSVAASPPYSGFTQLITLPHLTWEGRTTHALKIANSSAAGRPGALLLGGVHAREWGSPDILIYFVEQLQQAYSGNTGITLGGKSFSAAQIQSIVNTLNLYVFPQVNPDGRNFSMTSQALWRKNRRPGSACMGVDVNRNYDFVWNYPVYYSPAAYVVSSTDPCSDVYIGPSAISEPETQNAVWMMDNFADVRFMVDLHSFSELILYNWGDDDDQNVDPSMNFQNPAYNGQRGIPGDVAYREYIVACDQTAAQSLANRMQAAIQTVRGRAYTVEQALSLYPTSGTSDDYAFSRHLVDSAKSKVYGYTVEWGQEFQPAYSEMQNIIYDVTAGLLDFCLGVIETTADVFIKDNSDDTGAVPYSGVFWDNSDIFVRQNDDNVLAYQPARRGQVNYLYVQVTNRGPAAANAVQVSVRAVRYPGTEFVYPQDWTTVDTDHVLPTAIVDSWVSIPSGATRVAKFSLSAAQVETLYGWQTGGWHPCLLAEVRCCNDYTTAAGRHVWESNNLAQRNISIVPTVLGSLVIFPFVAGSRFSHEELLDVVIDRSDLPKDFHVFLNPYEQTAHFPELPVGSHASRNVAKLLDSARIAVNWLGVEGIMTLAAGSEFEALGSIARTLVSIEGATLAHHEGDAVLKIDAQKASVRLRRRSQEMQPMALRVRVPDDAAKGSTYIIRILQRTRNQEVVGGVTVELKIE
jgi:carboxypeptidase T